MTGIADLELTDTIDWAAITAAKNFALERPVYLPAGKYRIARALTFERGGLHGEMVSAGTPSYNVSIRRKAGALASISSGSPHRQAIGISSSTWR